MPDLKAPEVMQKAPEKEPGSQEFHHINPLTGTCTQCGASKAEVAASLTPGRCLDGNERHTVNEFTGLCTQCGARVKELPNAKRQPSAAASHGDGGSGAKREKKPGVNARRRARKNQKAAPVAVPPAAP